MAERARPREALVTVTDANAGGFCQVLGMVDDRVQRVVLEFDPGDPISGRIRSSSGSDQTFRGWLELASRLERLRATADSQDATANQDAEAE
jgi:hypothetical protein